MRAVARMLLFVVLGAAFLTHATIEELNRFPFRKARGRYWYLRPLFTFYTWANRPGSARPPLPEWEITNPTPTVIIK